MSLNRPVLVLSLCLVIAAISFAQEQTVKDYWDDFLHYTAIGRLDLAQGFAQKLLDAEPSPQELLELSEQNPRGYSILLRVHENNPQMQQFTSKLLEIIEKGRYERRTDPKIITAEIRRLSSTVRGNLTAIVRLRNAGEYAIPYMIEAISDPARQSEFAPVAGALSELGRTTVRPLTAALQTEQITTKAEIIKALGRLGYPESLGYLKYIAEKDPSAEMQKLAVESINQIDKQAANLSAAELFFRLAESYYYHAESLAPPSDYNTANIWFWDANSRSLKFEPLNKAYFFDMMTMRCCEWSLRADENTGKAIALWLAAFYRAESAGIEMPKYFGDGHAGAMTYATTAGAEYLHIALARAIKDNNEVVALGIVEALARNAGEKSLMFRIEADQPLMQALRFNSRSVRYSAAIAIAQAGPVENFAEKNIVVENLIEAVNSQADANEWPQEKADSYAFRAAEAMLSLARSRNPVINLSPALQGLVDATGDSRRQIQLLSAAILAYIDSPDAQRAVAAQALNEENDIEVRVNAFGALAISAKVNANQLSDEQIDAIYQIVASRSVDQQLRSAAAAAYGALNLPSRKVKDLILDQAGT